MRKGQMRSAREDQIQKLLEPKYWTPRRQDRTEDGAWCDKAWHLNASAEQQQVPATHVLRCRSCRAVYARCDQCQKLTKVETSMKAHLQIHSRIPGYKLPRDA